MTDDLAAGYRALMAEVYELAGRSRATSESFAQGHGQTAARWHALSVILEEPRTVPEIAATLGLTRQSVQRVVDDLVAADLVELTENPRHRRSKLVNVTAAGATLAGRLYRDSTTARRRHVQNAGLTRIDLEQARQTLRSLIDSVDTIAGT